MNLGKVRAKIAAVEAVLGNGVYEPGIMKKDLKEAFQELRYVKVEKFCKMAAKRIAKDVDLCGMGSAGVQGRIAKAIMDEFVAKWKRGF
jgi:hypothetical protein